MEQCKLNSRTHYLLCNRPRTITYKIIAEDTGLSERWVQNYALGLVNNPPVDRIEILYNYLSENKLDVI